MEYCGYQEGAVQERFTSTGKFSSYFVEIAHTGLNEHRVVTAKEYDILQNKIEIQKAKWVEKWEKVSHKKREAEEKEANVEEANFRTKEAEAALSQLENILLHTLEIDDAVDWESLKRKQKYGKVNFEKLNNVKYAKNGKPIEAVLKNHESKPNPSSPKYTPDFSFWDKIFKSKKERKIKESEELYNKDLKSWQVLKSKIETENEEIKKTLKQAQATWAKEEREYEEKKTKYNEKIETLKSNYLQKDPQSIVECCDLVLNSSKYPDTFPQDFELDYNPESKILIVEYSLPSIDQLPTLKEVKYIASRKELKESYISEAQANKTFDSVMYQITLRTIHELFEADVVDGIEAISFNGWVESISAATGKLENSCILSVQVNKKEFLEINLAHVDPKVCFKNLKGVGSSKLCSITPIKPILQIDRNDNRFVNSYDVANVMDGSTNLAAMDWEDFEHLVRELFEKEFKSNGGEVKVTQSSRDGGVDAVAFDPDPIRGGKIVIQAKRYTNTVNVAAVRDLYGTVLNEGATKGILVTTADYGPDAYGFAQDKPLTLLNGGNLLHLLQKHGHEAKIDLKEAKLLQSRA